MKRQNGFTLLEIAISLLIIGFLLAGVLGPLSTQMEQKERQSTQAQLDNIREALLGFAITHGRLPCPDNSATPGEEHPVGGAGGCTVSFGSLPYVTLGIPEFDAWREHFAYAVTANFADNVDGTGATATDACGTATAGVSFELCSVGDLNIINAVGGAVVSNVPVVVFSTGKHGTSVSSDQSGDEQENSNGDKTFVYRDFSQAETAEFDDLMIWISPNILKNRMVQAGRLP